MNAEVLRFVIVLALQVCAAGLILLCCATILKGIAKGVAVGLLFIAEVTHGWDCEDARESCGVFLADEKVRDVLKFYKLEKEMRWTP